VSNFGLSPAGDSMIEELEREFGDLKQRTSELRSFL
jgi:hypothetical protein